MNTKTRTALLRGIASLSLSIPVAATADSASAVVPNVVQIGANNAIRFTLLGSVTMCSAVALGSTGWGDIQVGQGGVTADALRNMVSVLTSAKLAGRPVKIYASNGTSAQFGCLVTGVEMQ